MELSEVVSDPHNVLMALACHSVSLSHIFLFFVDLLVAKATLEITGDGQTLFVTLLVRFYHYDIISAYLR